ncbi:hypothetical protein MKC54_09375 [[Clostridium] innocuum]|nr:hypothetical protein [[Clostridium] innocuum]MCR0577096.1 hypothetical protein [[Clostridium] innocuum]
MKLDELIEQLQGERDVLGNVNVVVQGLQIGTDGEVVGGYPTYLSAYRLTSSNGDVAIMFERVIYE